MLSELPDLDDDISFVVDNGASTGPIPLREIVESIRVGERAPGVLVWWAGATDWMRFDMHDDLVSLLEAEVAAEPAEDDHAADVLTANRVADDAAGAETAADDVPVGPFRWRAPKHVPEVQTIADAQQADDVDEVADDATDVVDETSMVDDVAAQTADAALAEGADDAVVPGVDVVAAADPEVIAPDQEAEREVAQGEDTLGEPVQVEAVMATEEVVEEATEAEEVEADVVPEADAAADEVEQETDELTAEVADDTSGEIGEDPDGFSFTLPTRETSDDDVNSARGEPALTGLFSAGARVDAGLSAEAAVPSPDALDAILAARLSLESVGARIDALTSATRRSPSPEASPDDAHTQTVDAPVEATEVRADEAFGYTSDDIAPPEDTPSEDDDGSRDDRGSVLVTSAAEEVTSEAESDSAASGETESGPAGSWHAVAENAPASTVSEPAATRAEVSESAAANVAARLLLTERFEEMVRKSVAHQRRIEWVMRVDELLLSACITAIADSGFVAMDLTSRESEHRVLFEHNDDSRHVRLDLSPVELKSDHLGRHVRFGLSWGRSVASINDALVTVRKETVEGSIPPGVLTCSADMSNSVVSTHVELILAADDLVKDDYSDDRHTLDASIAATLHALEERWKLLFVAG